MNKYNCSFSVLNRIWHPFQKYYFWELDIWTFEFKIVEVQTLLNDFKLYLLKSYCVIRVTLFCILPLKCFSLRYSGSPQVHLCILGTNDGRKNVPVDKIVAHFEELVDFIANVPQAHLIIPGLLPDPENDERTGRLKIYYLVTLLQFLSASSSCSRFYIFKILFLLFLFHNLVKMEHYWIFLHNFMRFA